MNDILLFFIPCEYQYVPKTQLEFYFSTCISFYFNIYYVWMWSTDSCVKKSLVLSDKSGGGGQFCYSLK